MTAEVVPIDDHLGADGLVRRHVVRDDRAQDRKAALVGIHTSSLGCSTTGESDHRFS